MFAGTGSSPLDASSELFVVASHFFVFGKGARHASFFERTGTSAPFMIISIELAAKPFGLALVEGIAELGVFQRPGLAFAERLCVFWVHRKKQVCIDQSLCHSSHLLI